MSAEDADADSTRAGHAVLAVQPVDFAAAAHATLLYLEAPDAQAAAAAFERVYGDALAAVHDENSLRSAWTDQICGLITVAAGMTQYAAQVTGQDPAALLAEFARQAHEGK